MIVDTTLLIDVLRGKQAARKAFEELKRPIKTTIINQYETFAGIVRTPGIDTEQKIQQTKQFFDTMDVLPLTENAMLEAAKITGRLIASGKQIQDNDALIAGIMKDQNIASIITSNSKHFSRIPGVDVKTY